MAYTYVLFLSLLERLLGIASGSHIFLTEWNYSSSKLENQMCWTHVGDQMARLASRSIEQNVETKLSAVARSLSRVTDMVFIWVVSAPVRAYVLDQGCVLTCPGGKSWLAF